MALVWKAQYSETNKPSKSDVGLGNVDNESKASILSGDLTGSVDGVSVATMKSQAAAGDAAKDAVDGNAAVTMVGGSIDINSGEFVVDSSGDCTIKGTLTIEKDAAENGSSGLTMESGGSGTMTFEMNGANPTIDLGGTSPVGTGSIRLRRQTVGNGCAISWYTGTSRDFSAGFSNKPDGDDEDTMWRMHHGNIYDNSSPYTQFDMSVDDDGKIGFWKNIKSFAGITIGSDGTNQGLLVDSGGFVAKQTAVTAAATTNLDVAEATNFSIALNRNITFTVSNLSGHEGQTGIIVLTQDGTGGRSVALASEMKTPRGDSIVFETGAGTTSILSYYIVSTSIVAVNYMGDFS